MLSQFWRDENTSETVAALEIEGWMDVLEYTTQREIREAWAEYQRTGPRTQAGKLLRPDAGAIYNLILKKRRAERGPQAVAAPAENRGPRVSPEDAQRIVEQAGFSPKRFP